MASNATDAAFSLDCASSAVDANVPPVRTDVPHPLRTAIMSGKLERFSELALAHPEQLETDDQLLILAIQISDPEKCLDVVNFLMQHNSLVTGMDKVTGNTLLHLACFRDFGPLVKSVMSRFELGQGNKDGNTPLHIACAVGAINCVGLLLGARKDDCFFRNVNLQRPYDVATMHCRSPSIRFAIQQMICLKHEFFMPMIFYHDDCLEHLNPGGPSSNLFESSDDGDSAQHREKWESPERLVTVMQHIRALAEQRKARIMDEFNPADRLHLERVHTPDYVNFVFDLAAELESSTKFVPFTPRVQAKLQGVPNNSLKRGSDSDTYFSRGSLKAAVRAAGSAVAAVDAVLSDQARCAMCVVRPPGHHAGANGLLEDANSCGFCIFNNVMVGAMHALGSGSVRRVAIVDIDAHHGNGTEEICRLERCKHSTDAAPSLLFLSTHIFDNKGDKASFYPGTGDESDFVNNIFNVPLAPLWRRKVTQPKTRSERFYYDRWGRNEFRRVILQTVLPTVRAFQPDLIMVSAGFDAANHDLGNQRMGGGPQAVGFDLSSDDFYWIATELARMADICCNGRIVCILEGGYGECDESTTTRSKSPVPSVTRIDREPLGRNVAAFVEGLAGCPRNFDEPEVDGSSETSDNEEPPHHPPPPQPRRRGMVNIDDDVLVDGPRRRSKSTTSAAAAAAAAAAPSRPPQPRPIKPAPTRPQMPPVPPSHPHLQQKQMPKRPREDSEADSEAAHIMAVQRARQLEARMHQERAANYIQQVRNEFPMDSATYAAFLHLLSEYKTKNLTVAEVSARLNVLFFGHDHLITGFNAFLPPEAKISPNTVSVLVPSSTPVPAPVPVPAPAPAPVPAPAVENLVYVEHPRQVGPPVQPVVDLQAVAAVVVAPVPDLAPVPVPVPVPTIQQQASPTSVEHSDPTSSSPSEPAA